LQRRRIEQRTEAFELQMHQRNAIEGTISELARGHGLRRSRYRGFGKAELQNFLIGTACNIKRWLRYLITKAKGTQTRASGLHLGFQSSRRPRFGVLAHAFWSSVLSWQALLLPC
jgi:Transposase DDE domain